MKLDYRDSLNNIQVNTEWLETSLDYFDRKLQRNDISQEDKHEIEEEIRMIRYDLNKIMTKIKNIAIIRKD